MVNVDRVRTFRNTTTVAVVDNFNLATQHSRGQSVKLPCADDTFEPECVAAQIKVLRRASGLAGRNSGERVVGQIVRSGCNPIGPPVMGMFRRVDFDRCDGFGRELPFVANTHLWVRLLGNDDFVGLPRTLALIRIRGESITALTTVRSQRAEQIEFARRLADDPRWKISVGDGIVARVNCYIMQVRRPTIYLVGALPASRRRSHAIGSIASGNVLDNSQEWQRRAK
jgi:hypothetical protein